MTTVLAADPSGILIGLGIVVAFLLIMFGIASTEKMRAQLHQPQIGAEEGLRRTQAYIRAKYASKG